MYIMYIVALFENKNASKVTQKIAAFGGLLGLLGHEYPLLGPCLDRLPVPRYLYSSLRDQVTMCPLPLLPTSLAICFSLCDSAINAILWDLSYLRHAQRGSRI
jgi:hypothetical protein